jgi:TatD DNase family protein
MKFFDTHCHLQDERIKNNLDVIVKQAIQDGVVFFVCCGSCESDWDRVAQIARLWKQVIPAFGIHPWYIADRSLKWQEHLKSYLTEFPEAVVGEIGLDHLHESGKQVEQLEVFSQQLEIAIEFNRRVSVHCLKAWGDLVSVLTPLKGTAGKIVLHSFSGSVEMVEVLGKMGCYFSCSGAVTHLKNKRIRNTVQSIPIERLLLESDTPDIPPSGYYGWTAPTVLRQINSTVASLRGLDEKLMANIAFNNALTCFKVDNG